MATTTRPPGVRRRPALRWILLVTAGEAAGFLVPAVVDASLAGAPAAVSYPAAVAAGAVEGALLGAAQAVAVLPRPERGRWIGATSAAAAVAWAIGMLPPTVGLPADPGLRAVLLVLGGAVLLASIPVAQWLVVRRRPRAWRWIPVNVLAWLLGTAWTIAPSPLVDERTPVGVLVVLYATAGLLMAATVAVVTAPTAVRLLARGEEP